jgi:endonuclease/exonuclease/phosphatase (EEP) superfamily protein YafD
MDELHVITPSLVATNSPTTNSSVTNSPRVHTWARCYASTSATAIDINGKLNILSWNVYKQNRSDVYTELTKFTLDRQVVLLQEASLNPLLLGWLQSGAWYAIHANAFKVDGSSTGVLIAAPESVQDACVYRQLEPWLRLPKSALIVTYPLSNGRQLLVVDLHAVNFALGMSDFEQQIATIEAVLETHHGPLLWAGDFNSWSQSRMARLKEMSDKLELSEVSFEPDIRSRFINGLVLDHLYYRGMTLQQAAVLDSEASDHNPILATFSIMPIDGLGVDKK